MDRTSAQRNVTSSGGNKKPPSGKRAFENQAGNTQGTQVDANDANAWQEELVQLLEAFGVTLESARINQIGALLGSMLKNILNVTNGNALTVATRTSTNDPINSLTNFSPLDKASKILVDSGVRIGSTGVNDVSLKRTAMFNFNLTSSQTSTRGNTTDLGFSVNTGLSSSASYIVLVSTITLESYATSHMQFLQPTGSNSFRRVAGSGNNSNYSILVRRDNNSSTLRFARSTGGWTDTSISLNLMVIEA